MEYAEAGAKDFERILDFFKLVDKDFVPPLSEREPLKKRIRNTLKDGHYIILEDKKNIVAIQGFIENYRGKKNHVYLTFFAVHPKYRQRGIGISFKKKVLRILKDMGTKEVHTRTWSTNAPMIKLNEKLGFKVEKIAKNERGKGIDSIYFKKKL